MGHKTAELLVAHKSGTQTIYVGYFTYPSVFTGGGSKSWHLNEVHVRTRWMPLPEFAKGRSTCKSTWRTGDPG
jgi:hypothetical protein